MVSNAIFLTMWREELHSGLMMAPSPPWVVIASMPFAPEIVIPTVRNFANMNLGMTSKYGFKPSFNQSFAVRESPGWWVTPHHFGIDQGPIALMIENYRTGLIWNIMRRCPP